MIVSADFKMPLKVYGAKLKDKTKLMKSQSGGAFVAIAEYFLKQGAVVYGCGMDENHTAIYKRISVRKDLDEIKGSKYVQAELGNTLKHVKADLENGGTVLFSGTPCYVLAVKNYVSTVKNKDNLYTVDIICHGVPSPLVYKTYLRELEERMGCKICKFIFRDKNGGGTVTWKK